MTNRRSKLGRSVEQLRNNQGCDPLPCFPHRFLWWYVTNRVTF